MSLNISCSLIFSKVYYYIGMIHLCCHISHHFSIGQTASHLQSKKTKKETTIVLDFYLTFYSLDHFLQPKDKNTQHKLKISHLIVYNFSSLIIILYFQSDIHTHLEAMERDSVRHNLTGKSEPHASTLPPKIRYHIVIQSGQA